MNFNIANSLLIETMPFLKELCTLKNATIQMQVRNQILRMFSEDSDRFLEINLPAQANITTDIMAFDANTIVDIIKKTDKKEIWNIELNMTDNIAIWKNSTAQIKITSHHIENIAKPTTTVLHTFTLDSTKIREGIKLVSFAISQSDVNPILTGILFKIFTDKIELVACDNFRLAVYRYEHEFNDTYDTVLPLKTINLLNTLLQKQNTTIQMHCYENKVNFTGTYLVDEHTIQWSMDTSMILGSFPPYSAIMGQIPSSYMTLNAHALYKMIDQVSVISKDTSIVHIIANANELTVKATSVMYGEYINKMPIQSQLDNVYNIDFRTHLINGLLRTFDRNDINMHISAASKLIICSVQAAEQYFYAGIVPFQRY